jgi:hypothetical protein
VKFSYLALPTSHPIPSLANTMVRFRPLVPLRVSGATGSWLGDCSIDSGTDDSIFPRWLATRIGVDLGDAQTGEAKPIGAASVPYCYAQVKLRLTDGIEQCEWDAIVGFVDVPLRWPILGHAGVLQFFDVQLLGQRRELMMQPNSDFPGRQSLR